MGYEVIGGLIAIVSYILACSQLLSLIQRWAFYLLLYGVFRVENAMFTGANYTFRVSDLVNIGSTSPLIGASRLLRSRR